jgi:ankyrin repeat protein
LERFRNHSRKSRPLPDRSKKERKKEWIGLDWIDEELIDAAKENNLPEVERLLSVGADLNAKDHFSRTPLHWASCRGHLQVFINFREHGADIEAKGNGGWSPLHWAAMEGHLAVSTSY